VFGGFVNVPRATFSGRFSSDLHWPVLGDHRGLHLFREYQVQLDATYSLRADWAIYDARARQLVAVFDLITSREAFESRKTDLNRLSVALASPTGPTSRFGLVVPQSLELPVRQWAQSHRVQVVTYPG
jgi:hypothetical protein